MPRPALAKDANVDPDGAGSHGLVLHTAASESDDFTDPDGFQWKA